MLTAPADSALRHSLLRRVAGARRQTDRLFDLIRPDSLYQRPITERHRIIFYAGHLEAFDWNLLQPRLPGVKPFDRALDHLFAFGIDPLESSGLPSDQPADWPALPEVRGYVGKIRETLDAALERHGFSDWAGDQDAATLLQVAIEHRLMHAETLAYMLHQLPFDQKAAQPQVAIAEPGPLLPDMLEIPAGPVTLGLARGDLGAFGWDNEYEGHRVEVPAFAIDKYKVTNADYLKFIADGGYRNASYWTVEDWAWISQLGIAHPLFWARADGAWRYRGMFDEIELPLNWPVYVSHAEARAYATWAGKALPTEAQWQRAGYGTSEGTKRPFPWVSEAPGTQHGYFDFARWDPFAVNAFPAGRSAFGLEGMLANGWEWTSTLFAPFPGFEPFPFYPGYSANFFDGLHYLMKGGSPRTGSSMLRSSFRNWFQPHYRYVYAGFRCVGR